MKQLLPTPWRVFLQAALPTACLSIGLFIASCLLVVTPGFAQDVLWGLTSNGGPEGAGTAFSIGSTGADFTVHKAFANATTIPYGSLVLGRDGNFYGMTRNGGRYDKGTVFKAGPTGKITVIRSLNDADGIYPFGTLVQGRDGDFYGMTQMGGNGYGTIFKISPTGTFTLLKSFNYTDGAHPGYSLVEGHDGNFYGMTFMGGSTGSGTIFKISPTGTHTVLKDFVYIGGGPWISVLDSDGAYPYGGLVQGRDGDFYGMTSAGGTSDQGTVFKISATGTYTLLKSFDYFDGWYPAYSSLVEGRDGNFYGMTQMGGSNHSGTIFKITPAGTHTVLKHLDENDGIHPYGSLVQGPDGDFYGLTQLGGTNFGGTVFKINATGTFAVVKRFNYPEVASAFNNLVLGPGGDFYGMTQVGEFFNAPGSIFKVSPSGAFTLLDSRDHATGASPAGSLVQARDGNFYGMTERGGRNDQGTIFKISPEGTHTVLKSFDYPDGGFPTGDLVEGSDGNFYGMNKAGITYNGTVFRISPAGAYTELRQFSNADGTYPGGSLVQGRDGNFYGMTAGGGSNYKGTIFKISPSGTFTVLKNLDYPDGAAPRGSLVQGRDGDFYGITGYGGDYGYGTIFKISPAGTFTVLKHLDYSDGGIPQGSLVEGSDGDFYGTTSAYSDAGRGTIFKISPTGTFTVLKVFDYPDGDNARGSLVEGSDGDFYGMTSAGGDDNNGIIFKISPTGTFTVLRRLTSADGVNPMGSLVVGKPACTPPLLAVPADVTVENASADCGFSVPFQASATGTPAPGITYKAGEDVITSPHVFPVGTTTVTAIAVNACGTVTKSFTVTVVDKTAPVPVVAMLPEATGECSVTVTAPKATDNCRGSITATTTDATSYTAQGTYVIHWRYDDGQGNVTEQAQTVIVKDETSPAIAAPAALTLTNAAGQCGRPLAQVALGLPLTSDNCAGIKAATHDAPAFLPVGTTTVTWTVEDAAGNRSQATQRLTLTNAGPVLAGITAPLSPVAINSTVSASADFGDNNLHEATWDWGNGTSPGTIDAVSGKITGSRSYSTPGVHTVTLSVTDACGATATASLRYVVVYDPSGGFVTGGGWFNSPAGAYAPNPSATGKAHFGFVSRYQKGASQPVGTTHLEFEAAGMAFHSSSYEWLVVAGGQAQYKGTGTLNGQGGYKFLLTAVDGQMNGGTGSDRLRIKIWQEGQPLAEYDNQRGAGEEAPAATALGGGSILVHEERSKARQPGPVGGEGSLAGATLSGYPNPFTGSTTLAFTLGGEEEYALEVYDLKGRLVARLGAGRAAAGAAKRVEWEAKAAPAGVYFARLTTRSGVQHLKLVRR